MSARIHRRELLRLSGLGIASLGLAPWIERAFADDRARKPRPPSPRAKALAEAWVQAQARGKPLLVLVVPAFRDGRMRGQILAAFLREASDDTHAELALCEVTCAMVSELRALLPEAAKELKGEPLAVLVEPDGKRARAVVEWIQPLPTSKGFEPTSREISPCAGVQFGRARSAPGLHHQSPLNPWSTVCNPTATTLPQRNPSSTTGASAGSARAAVESESASAATQAREAITPPPTGWRGPRRRRRGRGTRPWPARCGPG